MTRESRPARRRHRGAPRLLVLFLFAPLPSLAADPAPDACEDLPLAEAVREGELDAIPAGAAEGVEGAERIGSIVFDRRQIFDLSDPAENNALYALANTLHPLSREAAVAEQLPFSEGDPYVPARLRDVERTLRAFEWLYDARVVPVRRCGDEVDVAVVTRDVWSILPTGDFNRSGGESSFAFGVKDVNLLGRGETLGAFYQSGVDRDGVGAFYSDPSLVGTPWTLDVFGADNDDGGRVSVRVAKPFRSLDDRDGRHLRAVVDERVRPLFDTGFRVAEFVHRSVDLEAEFARSTGRVDGWVRRWRVGLAHEDHEFAREPGNLQPAVLPADRQSTFPFVGFELLEDRWAAASNLDRIQRAEDVYLGLRIAGRLGYSPDALGADDGRVHFSASIQDAGRSADGWLLSGYLRADGAVTTSDGESENVVARAGTELHVPQGERFGFYASLDGTWAEGLTVDRQILLGGDTGLRGYPQRFQDGDRRLRLRVEERWFSSAHPFRLFRYGAALFLDAGRSWFPGDDDSDDETGWLANVGIGLRLMPTRAPTDSMVHIDLAVPLVDGGRDVESVQVSLTLRETF
jgi:hypothetical protein